MTDEHRSTEQFKTLVDDGRVLEAAFRVYARHMQGKVSEAENMQRQAFMAGTDFIICLIADLGFVPSEVMRENHDWRNAYRDRYGTVE